MTLQQWLLVFLGPFLAMLPIVAVVAPQWPGFFGHPARRRPAARVRPVSFRPAGRLA